jgi:predicted MFS family arabinose efflux permease
MQSKIQFFGWSVARAAFVLAVLAWGIGFYGPSVFIQTLHAAHGWSLSQISGAVTAHFLLSAILIVFLPDVHRRLGIARTTFVGGVMIAGGLLGWSGATQPWHLFPAAIASGAGWAMTSGAALNAIVSRWFDRERPKAMALAFNGASVGGVLFVPAWILLIERLGFQGAAASIAMLTVVVVGFLSIRYLKPTPADFGQFPDGNPSAESVARPKPRLSRSELVRQPRFITLSAAFALGLFAQIGLLAHLIVRLVPDVGVESAGILVSLATICAVIGRTVVGQWLGDRDRRVVAAVNFCVQIAGVLLLIVGNGWVLLSLGCVLFGLGLGNLTSLPPLIAQKEFNREDVVSVVALVVAINQAVFAFAPALLGALRDATSDYALPFAVVVGAQTLAAAIILLGRCAAGNRG